MTLSCALAALFLFGTLFLRADEFADRRAAPTSLESAANGLRAAAEWLRAEGVPTRSLRERFTTLPLQRGLAASGNLLIVSLPAVTAFRPDEGAALDRWLRNGNNLLVLAALMDRPAWAQYPFLMYSDLRLLTGLRMAPKQAAGSAAAQGSAPAARRPAPQVGPPADRSPDSVPAADEDYARVMRLAAQLTTPERSSLVANRAHPYFTGVGRATAFSDYAPLASEVTLPRNGFALTLAHEANTGEDAFWIRTRGSGAIIVSGFGSLFSNRALAEPDNAQLLANLIAATLAPDGTVIFDDEHQGLSAVYDPSRFYRDPRLYATLAVIAAVWFTWVLGGTRLHAPPARATAPREAELVRATGLYLARVLPPAAAARRMLQQFLERAARTAGRDPADPQQVWEWLENHPRLMHAEVAKLQAWQAAANSNRRVPLDLLHNLIVRTERRLAA